MKKLLSTLALTPLLFATVHASALSDDINANMLWADNEEFQLVNSSQDEMNANMLWSDNEEFQRVNLTQDEKSVYINANMLWANNLEFHAN